MRKRVSSPQESLSPSASVTSFSIQHTTKRSVQDNSAHYTRNTSNYNLLDTLGNKVNLSQIGSKPGFVSSRVIRTQHRNSVLAPYSRYASQKRQVGRNIQNEQTAEVQKQTKKATEVRMLTEKTAKIVKQAQNADMDTQKVSQRGCKREKLQEFSRSLKQLKEDRRMLRESTVQISSFFLDNAIPVMSQYMETLQLTACRDEIQTFKAENKQLKTRQAQLQTKNLDLKAANDLLSETLDKLMQKSSQLEQNYDRFREDSSQRRKDQVRLSEQDSTITHLQEQLRLLKIELIAASDVDKKENILQLEQKMIQYAKSELKDKDWISEQSRVIQNLEYNITDLTERLSKSIKDNEKAEQAEQLELKLNEKILEIETGKLLKQQEDARVSQLLSALETKLALLEQERATEEENQRLLGILKEQFDEKIQEWEIKETHLSEQLRVLSLDRDMQNEQIIKIESENAELREQLRLLKALQSRSSKPNSPSHLSSTVQKREEIESLTSKLDVMSTEFATKIAECESKEEELKFLSEKLAGQSVQLAESTSICRLKQEEIATLSSKLRIITTEHDELTVHCQSKSSEIKLYSEKLGFMVSQLADFEQKCRLQEKQLKTLTEQLNHISSSKNGIDQNMKYHAQSLDLKQKPQDFEVGQQRKFRLLEDHVHDLTERLDSQSSHSQKYELEISRLQQILQKKSAQLAEQHKSLVFANSQIALLNRENEFKCIELSKLEKRHSTQITMLREKLQSFINIDPNKKEILKQRDSKIANLVEQLRGKAIQQEVQLDIVSKRDIEIYRLKQQLQAKTKDLHREHQKILEEKDLEIELLKEMLREKAQEIDQEGEISAEEEQDLISDDNNNILRSKRITDDKEAFTKQWEELSSRDFNYYIELP